MSFGTFMRAWNRQPSAASNEVRGVNESNEPKPKDAVTAAPQFHSASFDTWMETSRGTVCNAFQRRSCAWFDSITTLYWRKRGNRPLTRCPSFRRSSRRSGALCKARCGTCSRRSMARVMYRNLEGRIPCNFAATSRNVRLRWTQSRL